MSRNIGIGLVVAAAVVVLAVVFLRPTEPPLQYDSVVGRKTDHGLTMSSRFMSQHVPESAQMHVPPTAVARLYMPRDMAPPVHRVIMTFGPEGRNFEALEDLSNGWSDQVHAAVISVDLQANANPWARFAYMGYFIDRLRDAGLFSEEGRVIAAGVGDGGEAALAAAVAGGTEYFAGALAISADTDTATAMLAAGAPPSARNLPLIVLNGNADRAIPVTVTNQVVDSMRRAGFTVVEERIFTGGHGAPGPETIGAFGDLFGALPQ